MASQGPNSPGTMADDATVGSVAWNNPNNAKVSDNVYAMIELGESDYISHYLKATNFGFSIPEGATIDGIVVEIERKKTADTLNDSSIKIIKSDGSFGTTDKSIGAAWSTTESYISYGANNDLWGESWTATDINDANFGVGISAYSDQGDAYIDHIRITVYYTEAATGTNCQVNIGDAWKEVPAMKINIGDVWKDVASAKINIGDAWKTIF